MKVLIVDNYDSFTFNLYQYVGEILIASQHKDFDVIVKRNDEITLEEAKSLNPDRIIISPGPGSPDNKDYFGVCADIIVNLGKTIPLMGVCLGMQGIAHCFGGNIVRAPLPMHGKVSDIVHDEKGVYKAIPQDLEIMRYHSLMVEADTLPECLEVTSAIVTDEIKSFADLSSNNLNTTEIMGVRHKEYPIEGIQYHPESFATEGGLNLLRNFILA